MDKTMNPSIKALIRQVVPPIFITFGKALLKKPEDKRQATLRAGFKRLNTNSKKDEICFREGITLKLSPDSRVPFEAFCYGSPESVIEMDCFIEHTKDKHNLLDVGALHGIFSLVFAAQNPARRAVAVDASPIAFARLLYNIHKNQFGNITPIECALSAECGTIRMHYEWEHAVAAEITDPKQTYLTVEKKTGDLVCESLSFEPDVIKFDVEGHEVKVIRGLLKTIERNRPLIFLELHPNRIREEGDNADDIARLFYAYGYHAALVDGQPIQIQSLSSFTEDRRLILTP